MLTAHLKLDFKFDVFSLLEDLSRCEQESFTAHFNKADYEGEWTAIGLRTPGGKQQAIYAHDLHSESYRDTDLLKSCPYFKEVIKAIECEKESVRLLNLRPGSRIKEHTDYMLGYEDGVFRIHVPIKTNAQVVFRINGERVDMKPGECWYGNFNLPHTVENNGYSDRVHLVMDCIRNEWSDDLFERCGFEEDKNQPNDGHSREEILLIIEQLKRMDLPANEELIRQWQQRLNALD